MKIPNNWFYEGEMENRYNKEIRNKFINLDKPFLFINLPTDNTQKIGTSLSNENEALAIKKIFELMITRYDKKRFGFISPYNGQITLLKNLLQQHGVENNIKTIDSW